MNVYVVAFAFISFLKINSCYGEDSDENGAVVNIPFGQAKVKYHRSRYCITAFGQEHCVTMNEEPGDAAKIASLYKMWMKGYKPTLGKGPNDIKNIGVMLLNSKQKVKPRALRSLLPVDETEEFPILIG